MRRWCTTSPRLPMSGTLWGARGPMQPSPSLVCQSAIHQLQLCVHACMMQQSIPVWLASNVTGSVRASLHWLKWQCVLSQQIIPDACILSRLNKHTAHTLMPFCVFPCVAPLPLFPSFVPSPGTALVCLCPRRINRKNLVHRPYTLQRKISKKQKTKAAF